MSETYFTEQERAMRRMLEEHPAIKAHLALLFNGYRELVQTAMQAMQQGERDTADLSISCSRRDATLQHVGIPLIETQEQWMEARKQMAGEA